MTKGADEQTPKSAAAAPAAAARPRVKRSRPDAKPARMAIAAGAVAAITVIGAGLVRYPVDADELATSSLSEKSDKAVTGSAESRTRTRKVKRPIRYVRLKRGQKAPKGAKVIQEAPPAPRVVVRRVAAPGARVTAPAPKASRTVVARTRQSG